MEIEVCVKTGKWVHERLESHPGEDNLPGPQSDRGPQGWKSAVNPEFEDGIRFEGVNRMMERQSWESVGTHGQGEELRLLNWVVVLHVRLCRASCYSILVG